MEEITLWSPAKINLGLEVVGKREDGYHELITLFQTIELRDCLNFKKRPDGQVILTGKGDEVPWDETNLIFQAASLLKQEVGCNSGVEIEVVKNIPPGRGLGGGSSNAAITLLGLNRLWGLGLDDLNLFYLASRLGADVPFFLYGGLCLGLGKGEQLKLLPDLPAFWILLLIPEFQSSTPQVYLEYDRQGFLTSKSKESKIIQFLEEWDFSRLHFLSNDLELAAFKIHPQLAELKKEMATAGADLSMMSGSGSAVFGFFRDRLKALSALSQLQRSYRAILVETLSRERYWRELNTGASPNW